jgi:hypothetical protein
MYATLVPKRLGAVFCISLISFFISCQKSIESEELTVIQINLPDEDQQIPFDDLVKSVRFVPLGRTETNAIQYVDGVYVTQEGHFIVMDRSNQRIHGFDEDGQPMFTIHSQGSGPEEYNSINDVAYDPQNKEILVCSFGSKAILVFDVAGQFVRRLPFEDSAKAGYTFIVHGDKLLFDRFGFPTDSNHIGIFDKQTLAFSHSIIPYPNFPLSGGQSGSIIQLNQSTFYLPPYDRQIYQWGEDLVPKALYRLDFGKDQLSDSQLAERSLMGFRDQEEFDQRNPKVNATYLSSISTQSVLLRYKKGTDRLKWISINRSTGEAKPFVNTSSDLEHQFLPRTIYASDKGELIGVVESLKQKQAIADYMGWNTVDEDANPVLAIYTLK